MPDRTNRNERIMVSSEWEYVVDSSSIAAGREAERLSIWERIPRPVSLIGFVVLLLFLWQVVVWARLTPEILLPSPVTVAEQLWSMGGEFVNGGYVWKAFWLTAQEILVGFILAALAGILLGVLVAKTKFGQLVVMPLLVGVNAAPKVAFAPLFVAWLGFGIAAKFTLAAFIAFFPLLIDTAAGMASVNRDKERLFRSLRAPRLQTFLKLDLPSALPFIFAGLKTAAVLSVVGAIVGEFMGGGGGLGQLIRVAGNQLAIARVFAYAIILSIMGYVFYALIAWAERRIVFWRTPDTIIDTSNM